MYGTCLVRKQYTFPAQQSRDTPFPYSLHSGPDARKDGGSITGKGLSYSVHRDQTGLGPKQFCIKWVLWGGGGGGSEGKAAGIW